MVPSKHNPESWREAIKIISRCPICSQNYKTESAQLFAKNESASMVHITCEHCQSSFVAMLLMIGHGLSSVGMVTDMSYDDVVRLHRTAPLTTDEIIEGYTAMQETIFVRDLFIHKRSVV